MHLVTSASYKNLSAAKKLNPEQLKHHKKKFTHSDNCTNVTSLASYLSVPMPREFRRRSDIFQNEAAGIIEQSRTKADNICRPSGGLFVPYRPPAAADDVHRARQRVRQPFSQKLMKTLSSSSLFLAAINPR